MLQLSWTCLHDADEWLKNIAIHSSAYCQPNVPLHRVPSRPLDSFHFGLISTDINNKNLVFSFRLRAQEYPMLGDNSRDILMIYFFHLRLHFLWFSLITTYQHVHNMSPLSLPCLVASCSWKYVIVASCDFTENMAGMVRLPPPSPHWGHVER